MYQEHAVLGRWSRFSSKTAVFRLHVLTHNIYLSYYYTKIDIKSSDIICASLYASQEKYAPSVVV